MKLFEFLFGSRRVCVRKERGADLLNLCMKYRYTYYAMGEEDGRVFVVCPPLVARRLFARAWEIDPDAQLCKLLGAPAAAFKLFSRGGLLLGLIVSSFLILFSQNYVWDIRIEARDGIDADKIEKTLAECGLYVGRQLSDFSADETENLFLRSSEDIGWISVNMKGTVAYVEAMPKKVFSRNEEAKPANIVAERDGQIVEIITYSGLRVVEVGEVVRKGQLLISGAYGEKTPGLHVTRAAGRVLARTFHSFSVKIPIEYEEKIETGRIFCEKYIIFFTNRIKVFSNYGNLGSTCDKIIREKNFDFLGSTLPVGSLSEMYVEYEMQTRYRTQDEAEALARAELYRLISELSVSEILSTDEEIFFDGNFLILNCELSCIEDIAKSEEFNANIKGIN